MVKDFKEVRVVVLPSCYLKKNLMSEVMIQFFHILEFKDFKEVRAVVLPSYYLNCSVSSLFIFRCLIYILVIKDFKGVRAVVLPSCYLNKNLMSEVLIHFMF